MDKKTLKQLQEEAEIRFKSFLTGINELTEENAKHGPVIKTHGGFYLRSSKNPFSTVQKKRKLVF